MLPLNCSPFELIDSVFRIVERTIPAPHVIYWKASKRGPFEGVENPTGELVSCSSEWKDSAVVQMTLQTVCTVVLAVGISAHTRQREKYALVVTGCNMFFSMR